jgi:hypothetical protein
MRVKGSLPELVRKSVEREVGRYCEERVPPHLRAKIKMEYEIRGSVTLIERRPPWRRELLQSGAGCRSRNSVTRTRTGPLLKRPQ